jgi:hypothetical protein
VKSGALLPALKRTNSEGGAKEERRKHDFTIDILKNGQTVISDTNGIPQGNIDGNCKLKCSKLKIVNSNYD